MFDIGPSPFDVRFVLFRIPIRVHWSFWLAMILLGWGAERADLIFIWVICGFFSVLIHELGHALTAGWFGWPTQILLYFGGGLAISERDRNISPWRNLIVSIMGPGAGFVLFAIVVVVHVMMVVNDMPIYEPVYAIIQSLEFMNLFYGLFNLLPVLPLDGGNICVSICQLLRIRDVQGVTLKIGAVVAGAAAFFIFTRTEQPFAGAILLMLCLQNVGALQTRR